MAEKSDTLKSGRETEADRTAAREEARRALYRLHELGGSLPAVDAVAVVRAGRDIPEREAR